MARSQPRLTRFRDARQRELLNHRRWHLNHRWLRRALCARLETPTPRWDGRDPRSEAGRRPPADIATGSKSGGPVPAPAHQVSRRSPARAPQPPAVASQPPVVEEGALRPSRNPHTALGRSRPPQRSGETTPCRHRNRLEERWPSPAPAHQVSRRSPARAPQPPAVASQPPVEEGALRPSRTPTALGRSTPAAKRGDDPLPTLGSAVPAPAHLSRRSPARAPQPPAVASQPPVVEEGALRPSRNPRTALGRSRPPQRKRGDDPCRHLNRLEERWPSPAPAHQVSRRSPARAPQPLRRWHLNHRVVEEGALRPSRNPHTRAGTVETPAAKAGSRPLPTSRQARRAVAQSSPGSPGLETLASASSSTTGGASAQSVSPTCRLTSL